MAISSEEAADFERVKAAVLHCYEVNAETHQLHFRRGRKKEEESYRAWVSRVTDHFDKWIKDQEMGVQEAIITKQILLSLPENITVWLKEKKPTTHVELGRMVDDNTLARKGEGVKRTLHGGAKSQESGAKRNAAPKPHFPGGVKPLPSGGRTQVNSRGDKYCFACGRWGNLSYSCPNKSIHTPGKE